MSVNGHWATQVTEVMELNSSLSHFNGRASVEVVLNSNENLDGNSITWYRVTYQNWDFQLLRKS